MKPPILPASVEIEKISKILLKESGALGIYPTPVDRIIKCAELNINNGVDLSRVKQGYFSEKIDVLRRALSKVRGLIDIRQKTIYLDLNQAEPRRRFVQLHEVGHSVLPWQQELQYVDDDTTLDDPFIKEEFEREASFFASATLFQLERFEDQADSLPLNLKSALHLAEKIGSSKQSAIRRYVEKSKKRCAVIVLEKIDQDKARVRNFFESQKFSQEFGNIQLPNQCGYEFPFVVDMKAKRRLHEQGTWNPFLIGNFNYHFFFNGYNAFVFIFPKGEVIKSRTAILVKQ